MNLASLELADLGVSAFRGNPELHALARFLQAVKTGKFRPGAFLIVESLDRLSREGADEVQQLLLSLANAGIRVVQLLPVETVYAKPVDSMRLRTAGVTM